MKDKIDILEGWLKGVFSVDLYEGLKCSLDRLRDALEMKTTRNLCDCELQIYELLKDDEMSYYTKPTPSLCDTCKNGFYVGEGSASIGSKTYLQRYCDVKHVGIHSQGFEKCESYINKI